MKAGMLRPAMLTAPLLLAACEDVAPPDAGPGPERAEAQSELLEPAARVSELMRRLEPSAVVIVDASVCIAGDEGDVLCLDPELQTVQRTTRLRHEFLGFLKLGGFGIEGATATPAGDLMFVAENEAQLLQVDPGTLAITGIFDLPGEDRPADDRKGFEGIAPGPGPAQFTLAREEPPALVDVELRDRIAVPLDPGGPQPLAWDAIADLARVDGSLYAIKVVTETVGQCTVKNRYIVRLAWTGTGALAETCAQLLPRGDAEGIGHRGGYWYVAYDVTRRAERAAESSCEEYARPEYENTVVRLASACPASVR
jgi:hypothetical protein